MKKNSIEIVFLLDRSGSMYDSVKDTIGGYNSYIAKEKENKHNAKITTVLFDNEYELLHNREDINNINPLTEKEYFVRGCTALYDAIGITIKNIEKKINNQKVLFVITTDGLENASTKYTKNQIKEMVACHKDWEFLYLGANIDSYKEGSSLGIDTKNISNYEKSSEGTKNMFRAIGKASKCVYECASLNEDWKKELK